MAEATVLPIDEAVRRTELDRRFLTEEVNGHREQTLTAPYSVAAGPLGDSCESLRDLVAHVLMWDEINLAVLTEARQARKHWSLDPQWETREAGQMLNAAGVAAGRRLPVGLLLHRFATVRDALVAELRNYTDEEWHSPVPLELGSAGTAQSMGSLAQYVMTVPQAAPYWHAAIHLGKLTEARAR